MTVVRVPFPQARQASAHGFLERAAGAAALDRTGKRIVLAHLTDPTLPAAELARRTGTSTPIVRDVYGAIRHNGEIVAFVGSLYYSHRLVWATAAAVVEDWVTDPTRPARLLAGEPVLSRTVELHASRGTCTHRCTMCLWSDQDQLTYQSRNLGDNAGLLPTNTWGQVLDDLRDGGVETVVVSGGGEPLLNRDLPALLSRARQLGLRVQLYTTGFHMPADRDDLWSELAQVDQIRLSIHSPNETTYNQITGLPEHRQAPRRVQDNIVRLLDERRPGTRVGIGFVTQLANLAEIVDMADFAADLGVDFLHIRKDEVDVTTALTAEQLRLLRAQLLTVRKRTALGDYGLLHVDLGDELVAMANGELIARRRTSECLAKYFRPAISPHGLVAPCDLIAEPRFANTDLQLGQVGRSSIADIVAEMPDHRIPDACAQCMPSSRSGNAVHHKLLADLRGGMRLNDQPFVFQ